MDSWHKELSNPHLRCSPVTIYYPPVKFSQFLETEKRNLSKMSSLEGIIKTRLPAVTGVRGKSEPMHVTEMEHKK